MSREIPGHLVHPADRWAPTDTPIGTQGAYPFDPNMGGQFNYVWHCHIIDHEDNEMMRPSSVIADPTATRTFVQGADF